MEVLIISGGNRKKTMIWQTIEFMKYCVKNPSYAITQIKYIKLVADLDTIFCLYLTENKNNVF
jgi:hypothetical protein